MSDHILYAALDDIRAHLGAAKMQRAPSDDKIIAEHIDAAHKTALLTLREHDVADWQAIETAPRGRVVLLWKPTTQEQYVACKITGDHPGWCTPDGFEIFGATHWHHLPEPPALNTPAVRGGAK